METVSHVVERTPRRSKNQIVEEDGVSRESAMQAVDILVEEGYVTRVSGPNNSQLHNRGRP